MIHRSYLSIRLDSEEGMNPIKCADHFDTHIRKVRPHAHANHFCILPDQRKLVRMIVDRNIDDNKRRNNN